MLLLMIEIEVYKLSDSKVIIDGNTWTLMGCMSAMLVTSFFKFLLSKVLLVPRRMQTSSKWGGGGGGGEECASKIRGITATNLCFAIWNDSVGVGYYACFDVQIAMWYDLIQTLNLKPIITRISSPNIGMGGSNDTTKIFNIFVKQSIVLRIKKGNCPTILRNGLLIFKCLY